MYFETVSTARPDTSRATPYTGPLYTRHGRELAPATVRAFAAGTVRPC